MNAKRYMIAIVLVLFACVALSACVKVSNEAAVTRIGEVVYFQDPKTDLCFGLISLGALDAQRVGLATVPCDAVRYHLVTPDAEK